MLQKFIFTEKIQHELSIDHGHCTNTHSQECCNDGLETVDDEAVDTLETVHGADDHVKATDEHGRDTTSDELELKIDHDVTNDEHVDITDLVLDCSQADDDDNDVELTKSVGPSSSTREDVKHQHKQTNGPKSNTEMMVN